MQVSNDQLFNYSFTIVVIIPWVSVLAANIYGKLDYGRHNGISTQKYPWLFINARIGWFLQECPALFIPLYFMYTQDVDTIQIVSILPFIIHYTNRVLVYPLRLNTQNPISLATFLLAVVFCFSNGYIQSTNIMNKNLTFTENVPIEKFSFELDFKQEIVDTSNSTDYYLILRIVSGYILFIVGMYINISGDAHLNELKKTGRYCIPTAGLYSKVSSANYFGEILEWFGYFVVALNLTSFVFFVHSLIYLGYRGNRNHEWYKKKFEDYPNDRKAVIPYIY